MEQLKTLFTVFNTVRQGSAAFSGARLSPFIILFSGGFNLALVQWALVREMTALLLGTELVLLLISVTYFIGLSLGYFLAGRISRRLLLPIGVVTLVLHITLPIWFRLLAVGLQALNLYPLTYLVLPLVTPLVVSSFYSIFLPLFVETETSSLSKLYAVELLGSGGGILVLVLLGWAGMQVVFSIYAFALLALLVALGARPILVGTLGAIAAAWLFALPTVNYWSNSFYYQQIYGFPEGTITRFSGYSPYQKVDVLETPDGGLHLYLDGLTHFSTFDGLGINIILGQIPTTLTRPQTALVVGAGVMQTEEMIARTATHVTTVEIDPLVVEAGLTYFQSFNRMDQLNNRTVIVDDAKHFLATTSQRYDLIVTDTPAIFTVQTAALYSQPFYAEIAEHLSPGGVLAANLTSFFEPNDLVSRRIVASLLANFDQVIVVTPASVGWSFAYAGDDLPFDAAMLREALRANGELQFSVFDTSAVRAVVGDAPPVTLDSLDFVLQLSFYWLEARLSW
jgi:spermidine synthase